MTDTETSTDLERLDRVGEIATAGEHDIEAMAHEHPGPRQYVLIAIVLCTLTGFEVAVSYLDTRHTNIVIFVLATMAALKFFLVCAWYMHMKMDLAFFRRLFITGMLLAGAVYGILLLFMSSTVLKR